MISVEQPPREASMLHLVPKSTLGGTAVIAIGTLTQTELMALIGFVFTVLSFFINWYFQFQKHKRDAELNAAQIASIKKV